MTIKANQFIALADVAKRVDETTIDNQLSFIPHIDFGEKENVFTDSFNGTIVANRDVATNIKLTLPKGAAPLELPAGLHIIFGVAGAGKTTVVEQIRNSAGADVEYFHMQEPEAIATDELRAFTGERIRRVLADKSKRFLLIDSFKESLRATSVRGSENRTLSGGVENAFLTMIRNMNLLARRANLVIVAVVNPVLIRDVQIFTDAVRANVMGMIVPQLEGQTGTISVYADVRGIAARSSQHVMSFSYNEPNVVMSNVFSDAGIAIHGEVFGDELDAIDDIMQIDIRGNE